MEKQIEITTNVGCINMCSYCPQKQLIKKYSIITKNDKDKKIMSLENYKKYISTIPKTTIIVFRGMSEPFINNEVMDMILYTDKCGYKMKLYTTLLNVKKTDIDTLKEIKFVYFHIHLPNKEDRFKIDRIKYLDILEYTCKNISSLSFVYFKNLDDDIRNILHKYGYHGFYRGTLISRSGVLNDVKHIYGKGFCETNQIKYGILFPNGIVSLCCMDYELKHILGNLDKDSYPDLYSSIEYKKIRKMWKSYDSNIICRECEFFIPYLSLRFFNYLITATLNKIAGWNYYEKLVEYKK